MYTQVSSYSLLTEYLSYHFLNFTIPSKILYSLIYHVSIYFLFFSLDFLYIPNICTIYIPLYSHRRLFVCGFLQSLNPFFFTYILYILLISTPVLAAAPDITSINIPAMFYIFFNFLKHASPIFYTSPTCFITIYMLRSYYNPTSNHYINILLFLYTPIRYTIIVNDSLSLRRALCFPLL